MAYVFDQHSKTGGHWRLEADRWQLFSPSRPWRLCGSIRWRLAAGGWRLKAGEGGLSRTRDD
ncbi:hypothetical protein EBL85_16380 [Marichromatium sp. AB32]|nr:hypothetical protein EBL85_16380 [Marichromatium sp. AB32]